MRLRNSVIVGGVSYVRGSNPPKEVAEKISNPAAWDTEGAEATPPRAGAGSGVEAWRRYAEGQGVDVPEDASRDEIIALTEG